MHHDSHFMRCVVKRLEALPATVLNCAVILFRRNLAESLLFLDTLLIMVLFRVVGTVHPASNTVASTITIIIIPNAYFFMRTVLI